MSKLSRVTSLMGVQETDPISIRYVPFWFIHIVLSLLSFSSIVACNLQLHSHYRRQDFYILCEMGLQTEHHLSSTQTACYQQKQTKNCVTPLMWATDAKPLVSPWSCLHSAVILLSLVPPSLICMKRKQFISSLQIIQRVMMKLARAFGVLSLRRQENHWISWINEWIKIHLIILQEHSPPPHQPLHTYTHPHSHTDRLSQ